MAERAADDFGARMKRAREARGLSLQQIAATTKIAASALEALERNDISRLPGGIFSRAFVRAYAAEIGLDPERTVHEFLTQFPHDSVTAGSPYVPQEDHEAIASTRRRAETVFILLGVSIVVAGAMLYVTLARRFVPTATAVPRDAATEVVPAVRSDVPAASPEVEAIADPPMPVARAATAAAGCGEPLVFELHALVSAMLDVSVDGVRHEGRTMMPGDRATFQASQEIELSTSDAGALQLTINGQPAVSLGPSGEARTVRIDRRQYGSFLASR